jgi:hypothetical protein
MFSGQGWKKTLLQKFPSLQKYPLFDVPDYGPFEEPYPHVPLREKLAVAYGFVRSQIPGHNPAHAKLPALASEWLSRYDAGYDVTRWYTAAHSRQA